MKKIIFFIQIFIAILLLSSCNISTEEQANFGFMQKCNGNLCVFKVIPAKDVTTLSNGIQVNKKNVELPTASLKYVKWNLQDGDLGVYATNSQMYNAGLPQCVTDPCSDDTQETGYLFNNSTSNRFSVTTTLTFSPT
jgi:hypothetical protein